MRFRIARGLVFLNPYVQMYTRQLRNAILLAGGYCTLKGYDMNFEDWKRKASKKPTQYTHFDCRISLQRCLKYITSPQKVISHGFYPFIHYTVSTRKIKNGHKGEPKNRDIYYAAHIDSWIYKYYAFMLNEKYNHRLLLDGIDDVPIAYRNNKGKSNIDFSKKAFNFIEQTKNCWVMIGDFTNFFDRLDHCYLKQQLCNLLESDSLPDDYYAVFKNITNFSSVDLNKLLALNNLPDTATGHREFNSFKRKRAISLQDFKRNKNLITRQKDKKFGIPQGSPISAVLANIYMLSCDKQLYKFVTSKNGLYMRYSDDFIIIIPYNNDNKHFGDFYEKIMNILNRVTRLQLEQNKTKIFHYHNNSIENISHRIVNNSEKQKHLIEFLGFSFDGKNIRIRDKTISKYYNKLYRKIKTIIYQYGNQNTPRKIHPKILYEKYTYRGSKAYSTKNKNDASKGNFIDYVIRAQNKFGQKTVGIILRRHMQKIRKKLNSIK